MSSQLVVVALTACVGAQASGFLKPAYGAHDGLYGAYDTATINRHGEVLHRCPNAVGQTSGCHNIAYIAKAAGMPAGGGANGYSLAECQKEMHDLHGDTINYDPSVGRCDVKQCGSSDMKYNVHPYTRYMKILSYEVHSTFCMDNNPIISEMSKSAEKAHKSKKAEVKAQIAVVKSVARAGPNPIIALLMSFFNIIVCVALSYWAYKRHQDMKTEGKETKIGMWSMICCVTWTCCGGLGTPVGLCFPMDEDDSKASKAEEEAEAEAAAKAQEELVKAEADAAAEVKAEADAAAKVEAEAAAKVKAEAAAKAAKAEAEAAAKANRKAEADAAAKVKAEADAAAKVKAEADAAAKVVKAEADAAAKVKAEATKKAEDAKKAEEATEKATKAEEDA